MATISYLLGRKFTISTNHQSLQHLLSQKLTTGIQGKWLAKLHGYDYQVEYIKGKEIFIADSLSKVHEQTQIKALTTVQSDWILELRHEVDKSPFYEIKKNKFYRELQTQLNIS